MANFSTEFPIDPRNGVEDVINLACKWIAGSPHSKMPRNVLSNVSVDSEWNYSNGNERVTIAAAKGEEYDIGGLRYVNVDKGLEWVTSIVSLKTTDRNLLSIQIYCEALSTTVRLPPPKKPYFIRQVLAELGGGMDGEIPVTEKPFRLGEDDSGVAAALMMGIANNKLPIVYVSAGFDGDYLINPDELAKFVSGMAHVVVEPSRAFSFKVKTLTNSSNVFGGTVGVYWPESNRRSAYFLDEDTPSQRAIQIDIAKDIRLALSNRRVRTNCTWNHLMETMSRRRYDLLKAQGSTELQAYIQVFDADQAAKDLKIAEAEQEILRLNAELKRVSSIGQPSGRGLVVSGKEQDLFDHEISDVVISALEEALRAVRDNSRRQHILNDLLSVNKSSGNGRRIEGGIKSLFKSYRDMDSRMKGALVKMGFEITEDGKHYKAIFQGDGRYTFAIPRTSSDHRAGRNTASDINNVLF